MAGPIAALREFRHAWNAFVSIGKEDHLQSFNYGAPSSGYSAQPYRAKMRFSNERSIISAVYTRLALDVAAVMIKHVKLNDDGQYESDITSGLNNCLNVEANIDQGGRAFRQDIAMTLFDKGVCAIVPVDTTLNPLQTGGYDVTTMRVGEIITWYPQDVTVRVYNDRNGLRQDITLPKSMVAIIENPLYSVMNEPNSTLRRLIHKLNLLDSADDLAASGNLDIIIQLPYVIKTETRRAEAEKRRKEIETQLKGSQYGIAYADGTEKITQLNRPAENNLMAQVEALTNLLYTQLGLTPEVMNGTASDDAKVDYHNRTIEPIVAAMAEGLHRTFLTKTARSQGQAVIYMNDPFKLVPINDLSELIDVLSRNEIFSANDIRALVGRKPSSEPHADKLANKNMPDDKRLGRRLAPVTALPTGQPTQEGASQNGT